MLNAFFDYSRLDAPQLAVTPKAFPVNPLLEQLHNSFAAVAADKGLRLRLRPSPLWLQTDPVLLQRVLLNLVWGCRVSRAESAAAACVLARQCDPVDVLVSDYRLPGPHTGLDAVRMLRLILGPMLPACIISGDTVSDVRVQVQAAGLVLLQKPVRPAKLRSMLRHAGRKQTPLAAADESPNPRPIM